MTDQIKPASDEEIGRYQQMCKEGHSYGPLVFAVIVVAELIARIDELKAQLAAQEQSHKDILQAAGEEATRQITEKDKEINCRSAALRTAIDEMSLAGQALAEKDKRIAVLEARMYWLQDEYPNQVGESFSALSGGEK